MQAICRHFPALVLVVLLAGCVTVFGPRAESERPPCEADDLACLSVKTPDETTIRPQPRSGGRETVVQGDQSAAAFDQSTDEERAAATESPANRPEQDLGKTIATLGDVKEGGFWLKTPLVKEESEGRIVWVEDGNSVNVTLIPLDGPKTGGSQISLPAMRILAIPLTALPELIVFVR